MYEIRTITDEDVELFRSSISRGFGGDAETDQASADRFEAIFEYDRTFAVLDGDDIIGTGGGFSLGLTVPGGAEVPMGGTTVVTVQPTHRRRGVLRSLMDHHLDDISSRGEPLAGLWASESSIYGRFGYGPATYRYTVVMGTGAVTFLDNSVKGSVRLVGSEEADATMRSVYESERLQRVGMLTRSDAWWTHRLMADPESWRQGKSARRHLVFEENGSITGYATYRQKGNWEDFLANGEIEVSEVIATTPEAHTGIWTFLTNIDLFPNLEWWNMPMDDPLPLKITDPRRVQRKLSDALWIRIMDVPAALESRGYQHDGVVTFEVNDATRPDNSGVYRLEVSGGVGSCERVSTDADVAFETDVLGALYLGGGNAVAMAEAGRIEGQLAAATTLHRLLRTDQAPWCPEVF